MKAKGKSGERCGDAASGRHGDVRTQRHGKKSLNHFRHRVAASLLLFAFCLLPFAFAVHAQKVVDQTIALVNDDIITRTDLLWSIALDPNAPSPAGQVNSDVLHRALEVKIDQLLILQEARRLPAADITFEETRRKRTELIKQFASEAAFRERVESVGLTPQRINELVREIIQIERYVDFRFRSFVFVTEPEIQKYYDEVLVPDIRKHGQVPPPLDGKLPNGHIVRDDIAEIIKQQKINEEIDKWLKSTRERADIVQLAEP